MRQERFYEPHKQGLERLTGDNSGLMYCNERTEQEPIHTDDGQESEETRTVWVYDVYEVADCRDPHSVKNDVITDMHPYGDETKILRKTLAKVLKATLQYDSAEYAEFKAYNEFAESIDV